MRYSLDMDGEIRILLADRSHQQTCSLGLENASPVQVSKVEISIRFMYNLHVLDTQGMCADRDNLRNQVHVVVKVVLLLWVLTIS
jgi:hypothetical protein